MPAEKTQGLKNQPKVEVIIPTYLTDINSINWVEQAIQSVFSQCWQNWHLTIVDDASPVETLDCLERWCSKAPDKCSLIRLPYQQGAATARMEGISNSSSEYIAFLDQDDLYISTKLKRQVQCLLTHKSCHAVHTNIEHIDEKGQLLIGAADKENEYRTELNYSALSRQAMATSIFNRNPVRVISAMFCRSAFMIAGGYDCDLNGGEDWELWVRFADKFKISHIDNSLLLRRIHNSNTSTIQLNSRLQGQLVACEKMVKNHPYLQASSQNKVHSIERRINRQQQIENSAP